MCLAVPGKIIEIYESGGLKMAKIDYGGVVREACLAYVPEALVGEYAIVHVGFVLNILDEAEAQKTLDAFAELDLLVAAEDAEAAEAAAAEEVA
jgi:hydrogenase expression/formation protein HypC